MMFTDPVKNLKSLGLHENHIVADLGAGTGFYSIAAAHLVPQGKVYAVEVLQDYVKTVRNKAKDANLGNIEALWGDVEKLGGTKIGDKIVNAAIASNIFSQVTHKEIFLQEMKRILKPGSRILFIDWSDTSSVMGPNKMHIVPKTKAREMFEKAGFVFGREIDAGAHHYGMIFNKS